MRRQARSSCSGEGPIAAKALDPGVNPAAGDLRKDLQPRPRTVRGTRAEISTSKSELAISSLEQLLALAGLNLASDCAYGVEQAGRKGFDVTGRAVRRVDVEALGSCEMK